MLATTHLLVPASCRIQSVLESEVKAIPKCKVKGKRGASLMLLSV
jgi:hypothetical protein